MSTVAPPAALTSMASGSTSAVRTQSATSVTVAGPSNNPSPNLSAGRPTNAGRPVTSSNSRRPNNNRGWSTGSNGSIDVDNLILGGYNTEFESAEESDGTYI